MGGWGNDIFFLTFLSVQGAVTLTSKLHGISKAVGSVTIAVSLGRVEKSKADGICARMLEGGLTVRESRTGP